MLVRARLGPPPLLVSLARRHGSLLPTGEMLCSSQYWHATNGWRWACLRSTLAPKALEHYFHKPHLAFMYDMPVHRRYKRQGDLSKSPTPALDLRHSGWHGIYTMSPFGKTFS